MTQPLSRRQFTSHLVKGMGILSVSLSGLGKVVPAWETKKEELTWYNVEDWGIEGKGWKETKRYFDRLPGKAEGVVREAVWDLSRHSAGMRVGFATDATEIHVRYTPVSGTPGDAAHAGYGCQWIGFIWP